MVSPGVHSRSGNQVRDANGSHRNPFSLHVTGRRGVNTHPNAQVQGKQKERHRKGRNMIIAIDFDGVLVSDKFPEIGEPDWEMISAVWRLGFTEHELILWTSRIDKRLEEAVQWCKDHNLRFTCVNANTPNNLAEYGTDPRKAFANVYIDDRACGYNRNKALKFLNELFNMEEQNNER